MAILNLRCVLFPKVVFGKWRNVPDGVLGGNCHGTRKVQSTCRVLPRNGRWSCVIDLVYGTKRVTPFLEILLKRFYNFFNKDIEML
jgi:hypothetical protein